MPTRSFSNSALNAAAPGLSRLAMAIGGGGQVRRQAEDDANLMQSRIAQALSQIRQNDAQADNYGAQAERERAVTANLARRPEQQIELAALASRQNLPTVRSFMEATRSGATPTIPGQFLDGPNVDGSAGVPARIPDEAQSAIAQALLRMAPVGLNQKDIDVGAWAKAQDVYRDQDLSQAVINGTMDRNKVAGAQAAAAGKAQYNADATGAVLDLFGGGLDTSNPMAQGTIGLRKEQAGAQRANAAQSYAAADNSRASAAKTRAEAADGVNRGGARAPVGYRWAADGQGLETIPGGPADPGTKGAKLAKPPTEGQAKALLFGARMAVADEIVNELAGHSPNYAKQWVEGVPVVGGLGSVIGNAMSSPQQQQLDQAQRDFINAVLRRESGAAIAESEFANARRQYFPEPGDGPEKLRQKAANRKTAISAFRAEIGDALATNFDQIVGEARATRQPAKKQSAKPAAQAQQDAGRNVTVDY